MDDAGADHILSQKMRETMHADILRGAKTLADPE
jgi:hypothetical protein